MKLLKHITTIWLVLIWVSGVNLAQAATMSAKKIEAEHERAVDLARKDKLDEGLKILRRLLKHSPNNYTIRRDLVIITTWAGDCPAALQEYKRIQNHKKQEAYLIQPVSECLYDIGKKSQAIDKLKSGIVQWPKNKELKQALTDLELRKQTDQDEAFGLGSSVSVSVGTNESDQGNKEWFLETTYNRKVLDNTQVYARFITVRADDPRLDTGDLNRVGVGARVHFAEKWSVVQDIAFDTKRSGEGGGTTTLMHKPDALWSFYLSYSSFAEDLPLRAKAQLIDADRTTTSVDFHTRDYRWEWSAAAARYNFSDSNNRQSISTSAGYAYKLRDDWEQRLIFDLYRSSNSNDDSVVYFNPKNDLGLTLTHQTTIVYDTSFQRHVDNFYISLNNYRQKNIRARGTWSVRFEQSYDIDDTNSFGFDIAYNKRVYDGSRENQRSFTLYYSKRL